MQSLVSDNDRAIKFTTEPLRAYVHSFVSSTLRNSYKLIRRSLPTEAIAGRRNCEHYGSGLWFYFVPSTHDNSSSYGGTKATQGGGGLLVCSTVVCGVCVCSPVPLGRYCDSLALLKAATSPVQRLWPSHTRSDLLY